MNILIRGRLKMENCGIQNCTYPTMLPVGDLDEVELVECLVWRISINRLRRVMCRRGH